MNTKLKNNYMANENLKWVADFIISTSNTLRDDLKDKKISFFEALGLVSTLYGVADLYSRFPAIKAELKSLDTAGRHELESYISSKLNIQGEAAATLTTQINKAISSVIDLSDAFKAVKK